MLEKPGIPDETIVACITREFGLDVAEFAFLPLGGNLNTAVYRATAGNGTFFVKLRRGEFVETTVELPRFLYDGGIAQIIAPLETGNGQLRADLGEFKVIVYPFVEGKNGYDVPLTERQWKGFGEAMERVHSIALPSPLEGRITREDFSPYWRERTKRLVERVGKESFEDPIAAEGAEFLRARSEQVLGLVARTDALARHTARRELKFDLCHGDLHAGNLHIADNGALYIVDWDDPSLAPRERDLMFIGGGQGYIADAPEEEERLFYQGYGDTPIDPVAMAYYRYERAVTDIWVEGERVLSSTLGAEERAQSLLYFKWIWEPNFMIDRALAADQALSANGSLVM